ncbi:hypothetical protein HOY80DRAFT_943814 [Tuber brumale]|nr:hypothetical protein HOY80DRAFT_943814 [Tuber brumale]
MTCYLEAYYYGYFPLVFLPPYPLLTYCPALMIFNECYDCYDYTKTLHSLCFSISPPPTSSFSSYPFSRIKSGYPSRAYLPTSVSHCFFCFYFFSYHVSLPQSSCISFVGGYLFAGYIVRIPQPFFFLYLAVRFFSFLFFISLHFIRTISFCVSRV